MQQVATTGVVTTTTTYIGSLEEVSTTGSTTTTTAYYSGLAESVNGVLSYTLSDGLGSVSETATPSGLFVPPTLATQLYGPYGAVRYQSGTLPTDHGFTGQRSDAATSGLDYYGARYYDPVAGQFTSADTTLAGGLNRYAYVGGNPETKADPSGHYSAPPTGGGAQRLDPQPGRDNYRDNYIANYWSDLNAGKGQYIPGQNPNEAYKDSDGAALAAYFGLTVYGVDPTPQDPRDPHPSPDFNVAIHQQVTISPGEPGTADSTPPQYLTGIELYTPSAGTHWTERSGQGRLYGIIPTAYDKGRQASIMAIDISKLDPQGTLSKAELNGYAAQIVYWTPDGRRVDASQVARVIFIRNGAVFDDYNLTDNGQGFGPPAPGQRPPEPPKGGPVFFIP